MPEGYHACDGTPVLPDDDVSDEFRAKFTKYPLQDHAIIKTKSVIKVDVSESDSVTSLAQTVDALKSEQAIQNTRLDNIENVAANKEITSLEIQQLWEN